MTNPLIPLGMLEAVTGPLAGEDKTRAEGLLGEVSDLAREVGRDWTEVGGADPAPASVRTVLKRAALRAFYEDPEGFTDERLGDWQGSRGEVGPDERGVFFTSREEATLRLGAGRRRGTGSVRIRSAYGDPVGGGTVYVPVEGDKTPVPLLAEEDLLP